MIVDMLVLLIIHHEHARYQLSSRLPYLIGHLAAHLELSGQTTGMFHIKLLTNLAPLSNIGQIDWHALEVTTVGFGGALLKPREKAQDLLCAGLSPTLITMFPVLNF